VNGTTTNLNAPASPAAIGLAAYQGPFTPDAGFAGVTDKGSSNYDPDTIYITSGRNVYVTKDHGFTWRLRNGNLPSNGLNCTGILAAPSNRDKGYVIRPGRSSGGQVFVTTDAGQTWTDVTGNLPDMPIYKLVQDTRNGTLYLGTERGVWRLVPGG